MAPPPRNFGPFAPVASATASAAAFASRQPDARQVRRRDAGAVMPLDLAEAGVGGLPLLASGRDLVVAAAHEVPPHHELVRERLPAEQERASLTREPQLRPPGAQVQHVP